MANRQRLPETKTVKLSYSRGVKAFKAGEALNTCPYKIGSESRVQWRAGWLWANELANPVYENPNIERPGVNRKPNNPRNSKMESR